MPKKRGKKYIEAAKKVEAALASNGNGGLEPEVACQMVRETSISKFDATDGPRLGRPSQRHRQEGPRRGFRRRR
jgi:hypothetical protein